MCSLILFSIHSCDLLKYMNHVIKTCFQRDFKFIKKNLELLVTKVKLVTEIKKYIQLYFGTLVLAWYCYRGDNA